MLPRHRSAKRDDQADEDRMASRLELLGAHHNLLLRLDLLWSSHRWSVEQVHNARKSRDSQDKPDRVDIFRGVSFDDWLRMFMQVGI